MFTRLASSIGVGYAAVQCKRQKLEFWLDKILTAEKLSDIVLMPVEIMSGILNVEICLINSKFVRSADANLIALHLISCNMFDVFLPIGVEIKSIFRFSAYFFKTI